VVAEGCGEAFGKYAKPFVTLFFPRMKDAKLVLPATGCEQVNTNTRDLIRRGPFTEGALAWSVVFDWCALCGFNIGGLDQVSRRTIPFHTAPARHTGPWARCTASACASKTFCPRSRSSSSRRPRRRPCLRTPPSGPSHSFATASPTTRQALVRGLELNAQLVKEIQNCPLSNLRLSCP